MRLKLKYYIYDIDKPGTKEFDHLNEAMKMFISMKLDSSYTALGITKPSRAVDIIVKERVKGEVTLRLSKDFLSSSMYKDNKEEIISEIRKMTTALRFSNSVLDKILEKEVLEDVLLNNDLEM